MEKEEYYKELRLLYAIAKANMDVSTAFEILAQLAAFEKPPEKDD